MNYDSALAEYATLTPEEKMIRRVIVAAEVIEFAEGTIVELDAEQEQSLTLVNAEDVASDSADSRRSKNTRMKTFSAKPAEVEKKWILIDAEGMVVGRLAAFIANHLRGKHLPTYTPHIDTGDNVIVINADKVVFTGGKFDNKKYYYWHSRHPSGIKERTARAILEGRFPDRVLVRAVQRMMPRGPLSNKLLKNLKVYAGPTHPHKAQIVDFLDVKNIDTKGHNTASSYQLMRQKKSSASE